MLRANSLAAVTIFVWSTSDRLIFTACRRTAWRTPTISPEAPTEIVSGVITGILIQFLDSDLTAQHLHPFFYVESGVYSGQVKPEFHQGDCHRGLHSNHHG